MPNPTELKDLVLHTKFFLPAKVKDILDARKPRPRPSGKPTPLTADAGRLLVSVPFTLPDFVGEIKAKIKTIEIKPKKAVTSMPTIKKKLTPDEKEEINRKIQEEIKKAQEYLEKELFDEATLSYHDAAKLASNIEKHEMARVYSDRGEEILQKRAEILKERKKERKVKKKKKRKPDEILSKVEVENIKSEIGEIMRSARKAIRDGDYMSAAKQYQEVAKLYRKIQDEEKALYFEEKAEELL